MRILRTDVTQDTKRFASWWKERAELLTDRAEAQAGTSRQKQDVEDSLAMLPEENDDAKWQGRIIGLKRIEGNWKNE